MEQSTSMDSGLRGKVVLITGASGGIGRACADAFAQEGASLILHGHKNSAKLLELSEKLETPTLRVRADLRDKSSVKRLFAEIWDHYRALDVVVSNAGVWKPEPAPIHLMGLKRWHESLDINLTSHFLCAREFFRILALAKPEHAALIFVGSSAAVFGEADHCDYAAAKAGLVYGLTRSLKNEIVKLAPYGRVNAICPGWTLTDMAEKALDNADHVKRILQTRAHRRLARPEDIARAVVFLASHRLAGHITGEIWNINGGMEGRVIHDAADIDPSRA